jgi:hypothetical protein
MPLENKVQRKVFNERHRVEPRRRLNETIGQDLIVECIGVAEY